MAVIVFWGRPLVVVQASRLYWVTAFRGSRPAAWTPKGTRAAARVKDTAACTRARAFTAGGVNAVAGSSSERIAQDYTRHDWRHRSGPGPSGRGAVADGHGRRLDEGLVHHAIAFGQLQELGQLFGRRRRAEIEAQADPAEADGCVSGHAERSAEVEIALRHDGASVDGNAQRRRHRAQGHARAGDERLQQHVARAGGKARAAGGGMQPGLDEGAAGRDLARHVLGPELARSAQGHHGRGWILAITGLERRLQGPQLVWGHGHLLRFLERRYTGRAGRREMPQFVIERDVPGAHLMSQDEVRELARKSVQVLTDLGPQIQWIATAATENKVYCIYLAPDEATIREHAHRVGIPANRVAAVRRLMTTFDAAD